MPNLSDVDLSDMQIISTKTHGMIDYSTAATLIAAPHLLGFADGGAETWAPTVLGGATILSSLMTDYELGAIPLISMESHLTFDIGSGVFLALSPFLFGSYKKGILSWLPHVLIGCMEIAVALMTNPQSLSTKEDPMHGVQGDDISSFRVRPAGSLATQ